MFVCKYYPDVLENFFIVILTSVLIGQIHNVFCAKSVPPDCSFRHLQFKISESRYV